MMTLDDAGVTVSHHFGYWKKVMIPADRVLGQHAHKFDHYSLLMKGIATVETDKSKQTYRAPSIIFIEAGVQHKVTAFEDTEWWCLHETDERDVCKIDESLIV